MIIKRKEFIDDFVKYIRKKLMSELPEEDFEIAMLDRSLDIIRKHSGEVKSTLKHP